MTSVPSASSRVFCLLPWVHMSVDPGGEVMPCCVSSAPLGRLEGSSLAETWNSREMKALRRAMLEGRRSEGCGPCYRREDAGLPSLRTWANARFAHHEERVGSTRDDGGAGPLFLPYLDVRFSNVCNFRCRTCGPELSTAWYADARRLPGGREWGRTRRPLSDPRELRRQVEPLLEHVEEIRFQGGEPLLMAEHYWILDRLVALRRFQVVLRYNTNFSTLVFQGRDVLRLWDRFETVHVAASLDGMGRRGEYLRKGQVWSRVLENHARLREFSPRLTFQIAPTLGAMNSLHLPEFHRAWVEEGRIRPEAIYLNPLHSPGCYSLQMLPKALKARVAERYEAHARDFLEPLGAREAAGAFRGAAAFMDAADLSGLLPEFRRRTSELDRVRGERFADVFPELAELAPG